MERNGKYVLARSLANASAGVDCAKFGSRPRRQSGGIVAGVPENGGGAVALVDVAVHGHGALDELPLLQAADGDGEVVDHAKTFAVIGEGVMKAAADADADAVGKRALGRQNGTAGMEHESVDHLRRVRDFHLEF